MKNIDISQIVEPTALQPFTANSLKFLQDYNTEDKAAIIKALVITNLGSYSLTVPYVISGCTVSDSGKDVTAGEIFYGGAFYETTAINGTTNIARFIKTKTQDAVADPLIFTDSSSKSVHDIFKYVGTDVASGGDFTSANLVSLYGTSVNVQYTDATSTITGTSYADITGFSHTITVAGKYEITLKTNAVLDESTGGGGGTSIVGQGEFRLWNDSDSVELDYTSCKNRFDLSGALGVPVYRLNTDNTVVCTCLVDLTVGKVIKAQVKKTSGVNVVLNSSKFIIKKIE
jgi:hypothetical protein